MLFLRIIDLKLKYNYGKLHGDPQIGILLQLCYFLPYNVQQ